MEDKTFITALITLFVVAAILIGVLAFFTPIKVKIETAEVSAEEELPDGVTKFEDGFVTCYILNKYHAFATNDRAAGISCVVK